MARAVGFFRAVYRLHRTEAAVLLLWRDGSFDLAVPDQKVSSVSVKFDLRTAMCRPGRGSSGRCTAMAGSPPTPARSTRTTRRSSMGSTSSSATSTGAARLLGRDRGRRHPVSPEDRPAHRAASASRRAARRLAPEGEAAPPRRPRRSRRSRSTSPGLQALGRDPKPSRRELEDALDRAGKMATAPRLSPQLLARAGVRTGRAGGQGDG